MRTARAISSVSRRDAVADQLVPGIGFPDAQCCPRDETGALVVVVIAYCRVFGAVGGRRRRPWQPAVDHREADQRFAYFVHLPLRFVVVALVDLCRERNHQGTEQQGDDDQHDGQFDQGETFGKRTVSRLGAP